MIQSSYECSPYFAPCHQHQKDLNLVFTLQLLQGQLCELTPGFLGTAGVFFIPFFMILVFLFLVAASLNKTKAVTF